LWNVIISITIVQDDNIIGKNNPRTYKHIIIKEAIIIVLTALIFIQITFPLI